MKMPFRWTTIAAFAFAIWSLRCFPHIVSQSHNGFTLAAVFCCWIALLPIGLLLRDPSDLARSRGPWLYAGITIAVVGALADVTAVRHFGAAWILSGAFASPSSRWVCVAVAATWIPGCERFWLHLGLQSLHFRLVPIVAAGLFFVRSARHCLGQRRGT